MFEAQAARVRAIDHTADVGLEIEAADQAALFDASARGMSSLIAGLEPGEQFDPGDRAETGQPAAQPPITSDRGTGSAARESGSVAPDPGPEPRERQLHDRSVSVTADDAAGLLLAWLRELLWIHDSEGLDYAGAQFLRLDEQRLEARVLVRPPRQRAARELKGVTYHGLSVDSTERGWRARVIFDV